MMLHDLGLKFNSPFVNLWINSVDFLTLCSNPIDLIQNGELEPTESDLPYPVGHIEGHTIYFQHYGSFEEAKTVWNRRIERIDWDDTWILLVKRTVPTLEDRELFETLPNEHKLLLEPNGSTTSRQSLALPKATKKDGTLPILTDYSGLFGVRYYDEFDFRHWFSTGEARLAT